MRYIARLLYFLYTNRKKGLKLAGISLFMGLFFVVGIFIYYSRDLPSPGDIGDLYVPESTKIFDRTESVVLYDIYQEQKRTVIAYEKIPETMAWATIVGEDDNFYHHIGIDVRAIARAFLENIKGGRIRQGGSTITQQFVKNALLTPERTLSRKIKELILALELEWKYSKDEILSLYLNQVPYGSNAYGVEAAAQTYFGKHTPELTLAETALLASLPKAPTYYSPYGNNRADLFIRQEYILDRMLSFGYINSQQHNEALNEDIVFKPNITNIEAPHFVIYVREYLEEKYGSSFIQQAGLRVITTLDETMQNIAEEIIEEAAEFNEKNFNASNAALVALDPTTGQILVMVGSRDYFEIENDGNVNVTLRPRQPGSSFKPFAYAAALQKGYTPNTILYDVPTEFNSYCSWEGEEEKDVFGLDCYHPQNYDELFVGPISFKEALAQSRNVPSVKVLYLAGIEDTIELARKMGISSLRESSHYGLALVLGGGEVTLLDETSAYGVFATRGELYPPSIILRIEDRDGNILEKYQPKPQKVLEENIADQITSILSSNELRAPVFGEQNYLTIKGLPLAAKTGTTQEYRDAWTVGYTPSLAVGVWVGNNDNTAMREAPGASAAAPIWNRFIRSVYEQKTEQKNNITAEFYFDLPNIEAEKKFTKPEIIPSGKGVLDGVVLNRSILHFVSRDDPLGEKPDNPIQNPQYRNWENAVLTWLQGHGGSIPQDDEGNMLSKTSPDEEEELITINFISPTQYQFSKTDTLFLEANISAVSYIKSVKTFLDSIQVNELTPPSSDAHSFSFAQSISLEKKDLQEKNFHEIIVEVQDVNNITKKAVFVFIIDN